MKSLPDILIQHMRSFFETVEDPRASNTSFRLADVLLSAFAVFFFKYESLLEFDVETHSELAERDPIQHNLKAIFGVKKVISDSGLRKVLDQVDWRMIVGFFAKLFFLLQEKQCLKDYKLTSGHYVVSIDGVEHFHSTKVHCPNCIQRKQRNGEIHYSHSIVCAVLVNPHQSQVFVLGAEPVVMQDGSTKLDSEQAASKRLIPTLQQMYPSEKFLIVADALYSKAPAIEHMLSYGYDFLLSVKPGSSKHLFQDIDSQQDSYKTAHRNIKGKEYIIRFKHNVRLVKFTSDKTVNVIHCIVNDGSKTTQKTWVTNLDVNHSNVQEIVEAAESRWKIENETFNTLKNQGYNFSHNFGHGKNHLSSCLAQVMLLAFTVDQIILLEDANYKKLQKRVNNKKFIYRKRLGYFMAIHYKSYAEIYKDLLSLFKLNFETNPKWE